ncbi:type II secretion system protein [candidate division WWE3 bacterium]|uniref:Type II secretion system protein n=1 Tax=candidate division WWE3 bacterium TaxID=2053526 RepID=A0A955RP75_UNCKA|nr:type II secretion system protein [candidate division WWE3 bacterium]
MKTMKKGFTLIELLVVIAVLGILAAVVLVAINPQARLQDARNSGVRSDIGQIGTALEAYFTENNGAYPAALANLTADNQLKTLPTVPTGRGGTCTPATGNYTFTTSTSGNERAVSAQLEPCGSTGYYVYWTKCGKAREETSAPTAATADSVTC